MNIRLRVVLAFVVLIALVLAGGGVTPNTATHDNTPPPTNTTGTTGTTSTTST